MEARYYQSEAHSAVFREWGDGKRKTLVVMPTGSGKTIVFSLIIKDCVRSGKRVLVLAHRGELLDQAADKLGRTTGLRCSVEKAELTSEKDWYMVTVGSVQSMSREKRLARFNPGYYSTIVVDEAHHALTESYQRVLDYFDSANVLGVTATPDRGDMRNLGQYFDSLAYEYTLPKAIKDGYLCPIKAQTIPIRIDMAGVKTQSGDYAAADVGNALDPYLEKIAQEMSAHCKGHKTVVFLPLIRTSQKFCGLLQATGFRAAEVNGESRDRADVLAGFESGKYDVLCNSMLLTEGWDCPPVDCIVPLRPTKIRSLYSQMVGRGTRIHPGKDGLLLLDFLWHTERHDLCRPAHLVAESAEVQQKMIDKQEEDAGANGPVNLIAEEAAASSDVVEMRERALAEKLKEMRHRKRKLVDPLQYAMSIAAEDLANYTPVFASDMAPASDKQKAALEKAGILPDEIANAGMASLILNKIALRRQEGLATPKQIRFLEGRGFYRVGEWDFDAANGMITRIQANNWMIPRDVKPAEYKPERSTRPDEYTPFNNGWEGELKAIV